MQVVVLCCWGLALCPFISSLPLTHTSPKSLAHSWFRLFVSRASTYKQVTVTKKQTFLVAEHAKPAIDVLERWNKTRIPPDQELLREYSAKGWIFPFTSTGSQSIIRYEQAKASPSPPAKRKRPSAANVFVNVGSDQSLVLVEADAAARVKGEGIETLVRNGQAYMNLTSLFCNEEVNNRARDIARKIKAFPMGSLEYTIWANKSNNYEAASLTQAMALYLAEYSVADVGDANADYQRKRGYVGTMAPGAAVNPARAVESLPKHLVHPWPAFQEIPFHVRWPVHHPHIPTCLAWCAKNNMLRESDVYEFETTKHTHIFAGVGLTPWDAHQIAKYGTTGLCFDPAVQVRHPGLARDPEECDLPHYTPDHGSTIPAEEVELDLTLDLVPMVKTWVDPFFGVDMDPYAKPLPAAQVQEMEAEEEIRRKNLEQMFGDADGSDWMTEGEQQRQRSQRLVEKRLEEIAAVDAMPSTIERVYFRVHEKDDSEAEGELVSWEDDDDDLDVSDAVFTNTRKSLIRTRISQEEFLRGPQSTNETFFNVTDVYGGGARLELLGLRRRLVQNNVEIYSALAQASGAPTRVFNKRQMIRNAMAWGIYQQDLETLQERQTFQEMEEEGQNKKGRAKTKFTATKKDVTESPTEEDEGDEEVLPQATDDVDIADGLF